MQLQPTMEVFNKVSQLYFQDNSVLPSVQPIRNPF